MDEIKRLTAWALVFIMALTFPSGMFASGDTETHFGDGNTERTVTFDGKGSDNTTTIKLPHEAEVSSASLKLKGEDNAGSYLYHPTVLVDRDRLWNFNGSGYGHLGEQEVFYKNSSSASLQFSGGDYQTTTLYLPRNATVNSASMDISGKKSAGAMTPPEVMSNGTLITSDATNTALAADGAYLYAVWQDNGDLNYAGNDYDIFFKRSSNNGQTWTQAVCISETTTYSYYPSIAVSGSNVYVAWYEGGSILFRMSTDRGDHWGDIVEVTDKCSMLTPGLSASGSYIYMVWDYGGDIYFGSTTDGTHWTNKTISEQGGTERITNREAWVASRGNYVYVIWYERNDDQRQDSIAYKYSSNNGQTFPESTTYIDQQGGHDWVTYHYPKVACNENGHVYAVWRDSNGDLYYSHSSNNGQDLTWSNAQEIDDTDESITYFSLSSEKQSGVNNVYVAWEDSNNISFTRSTDESTFSSSTVLMEYNGYNPSVVANDDGHVYVAYHITNETNDLYNYDIYLNISSNQGSSFGEGTLLSWELFDGLSGAPAVAVDGDKIYLVWEEHGNLSGVENGVDGDIFFRYFDGSDWSGVTVLSDDPEDGVSAFPDIAVDGQNIYVVWHEYGNVSGEGEDADIVYRYSSDGGQHWNPVTVLSDDPNDGESIYPRVAVYGSTAHVVWQESGNISGSGTDYDVCYRKVVSGTPVGGTTVLSDESDGASMRPDIAVNGQNVYVVWYDASDLYGSGTDYDIFFRQSSNGGSSWQKIVVVSQTTSYSYNPVISVGSYIYVAWRESYPQFSRSSDGTTWSAQTRISSQYANELAITSNGDDVYVGYSSSLLGYGLYLSISQDAGDSWEDPADESVKDSNVIRYPAMGYGDGVLNLFWGDNGNISGSGYDDDIIYRHSLSSYPSNVTLDVGDDGTTDWSWAGELNDANSPQTYTGSGFVNALNNALSGAEYFTDAYGNDIAEVVLNITSDTGGVVYLDHLKIDYDYSAPVQDFNNTLNNYLKNHQNEQDSDGNIIIPLTITTDTAGKMRLSELNVVYELKKTLTILTPEENDVYTTTVHITWSSENFGSGDQIRISYNTGGGAWTEIATVDVSDGSYDWDSSDMNGRNFRVKIEYTGDSTVSDISGLFMIDNYPPTTSHAFSYTGQYTAPDDTVWAQNVSINLIRNDRFQDGDMGSGVNHTYYRIDDGAWEEYTAPFYINTHGQHTFDYYSVDRMGNTESTASGEVHIDAVPPVIGEWTVPNIDYRTNGTVEVSVQVSDADTGINPDDIVHNRLQYALGDESFATTHQGWHDVENPQFSENKFSGEITEDWFNHTIDWGTFYLYLRVTAADNVGNTANAQTSEVVERDSTPPVITGVGSSVGTDTDNTYYVGSVVRLYVYSDESGLTGSVQIPGGSADGDSFTAALIPDDTTYYCDWNTTGLETKIYSVKFMLTDASGNSVSNDSLNVKIEEHPYPELLITGILVDQNGESNNIGEGIQTSVTVSVRNSGTQDVTGAVVKLYDNQKDTGHLIGTRTVDIPAGGTISLNFTYMPEADKSQDVRTLYAMVEPVAGEKDTENNEDTVDVTVRKLPDLTITSVKITDADGKEVTEAKEGDNLRVVAEVKNIGDVSASATITAYSNGVRISSETVTVNAGATETVTINWASVPAGELNVTVKADANREVREKNEDNNEMTTHLSVEKKNTGGGGSTESKSNLPVILMGLVILLGGIGAAGYLVMQKKKGAEEEGWESDEEAGGWVPPAPGSEQETVREEPAPGTEPAPEEKPAEERPAPKPVKVKCPKCGTILSVKTDKRPVVIKCPKCETKLTLKK